MKFLAANLVLGLALSQALAQTPVPAQSYQADVRKNSESEFEMTTAFLKEQPLFNALLNAPELIMERMFWDAKKNAALSQQTVYTIRAITAVFKEGSMVSTGEQFKALKDLKTREAAIHYAESVAAMGHVLTRHLSGADPNVPDMAKLLHSVNQRRTELVAAFPALKKPK